MKLCKLLPIILLLFVVCKTEQRSKPVKKIEVKKPIGTVGKWRNNYCFWTCVQKNSSRSINDCTCHCEPEFFTGRYHQVCEGYRTRLGLPRY